MKLTFRNRDAVTLPSSRRAATRFIADLFLNSGRLPEDYEDETGYIAWGDMVDHFSPKVRDAVSSSDIRPLLQEATEILIREPVEPLMVITGLFNRVAAQGLTTRVLGGAIGAVVADDVAEHGEYPEVMFNVGPGMQVAFIGKSGIQASFTDEALRYSTWDLMALNLRLMGQALVRHKEQKAVSFLKTLGTELFNNVTPATSLFGVTTGRGLDMAANGSLTMDDLFRGMAHMAEEGFHPDVILMNPLFFYTHIQDPVLRAMMLAHGGGDWFRPWNGVAGPLDPWSNGQMGARGPSLGNKIIPGGSPSGHPATGIAGREHGMTAQPPLPTPYFPWNMRVVVSPLVPFDAETQLGDIFLLSSGNVGFYLVDEEPVTVEWRDESVDVVKVKVRERYGFAVAHEGQGVGVLKNVKLARNYWDGTVRAHTLDVASEIQPDTDLSGVL